MCLWVYGMPIKEAMDFYIERLEITSNHIKNKEKLRYLGHLNH